MNGRDDRPVRPWETVAVLRAVAATRRGERARRIAERRANRWATAMIATAMAFVVGVVAHEVWPRTPNSAGGQIIIGPDEFAIPKGFVIRDFGKDWWFDPRWSRTMESELPDYWYFRDHRYTTRDLMGRSL